MPVDRVLRPTSRSSPLPKRRYTIPSALPPAFGVSELYDWSVKTPSSSSRSSSAGHSTFRRYSEKRGASSSVKTWVDDQGIRLPSGSVRHGHPPSIPATDTGNRRPLFAPSSSPTPSKHGSSQVPLQLPSPAPSPVKPQLRPKPTLNTLNRPRSPSTNRNGYTSSVSTSNIRASATYPARRPEDIFSNSADSEVEVLSASEEDEDDEEPYGNIARSYLSEDLSEDESEDLEDDESELGESGRMRASRYIDLLVFNTAWMGEGDGWEQLKACCHLGSGQIARRIGKRETFTSPQHFRANQEKTTGYASINPNDDGPNVLRDKLIPRWSDTS
ncbi:hypothetical protein FRC09_005496 [Ceratobasidium sp. 395]|nr:hypothetical protein FRC09_005496 [Ceratobasidium sp. 395]